jgi:signal transduction histidine kinase/ligand-binding sensor domain-containing protein
MQEAIHGRRHVFRPGIALAWMLLVCFSSVFALDPSLDINQYSHHAWTVREGFFKGEVGSIAQTPDGYIWLGTTFGLVRFDGVKSVNWQPPQNQHLPANGVMRLLAARDGTLWIGTVNGLASLKNDKLTVYPETTAHFIFAIVEDPESTVWVSALSTTLGKLCAIRNGSMSCEGEGTIGRGAFNLYVDSRGTLWAGVKDGLWRWSPGPHQFYSLPGEPNGIQGLGEAEDGTLLVAWNGKLQRFRDGKTGAYPLPGITGPIQVRRIFRDHDGCLWLATARQGLLRLHAERADVFAQPDGLSGDSVHSLFEDRESNIWVTTANGLDRFRNFAVPTLTTKQGLSHDVAGAVLADKDGSLWFSTSAGLDRWRDGKIETYPPGRTGTLNDLPASLFQDRSGRIWVSKTSGFGYLEGRRFVPLRDVPQGGAVLAVAQDRAGDLWLANEHLGLFHGQAGNAFRQIAWETLGNKEHAGVLAADPARGGIWIGFFRGGIAYFENGQVRESYTPADGLGAGRISSFHFDDNGAIWISTEQGGLSRLKNGTLATLTSKNGLPCDTVNWVMEDGDHAFWLYTACGLLHIERSELDAWVADPGRTVRSTVFDISDGVRTLASSTHYNPVVAKTSDGRLWFLPLDGVSVIDPRNLHLNKLPPPVHVEQFIADRQAYDASGQVRLPPLIRDLEINYTALSLVAPEKILFRYKLEGYDRDWQDVGNRRQAFYTNLPPRNYRFRVIACNNSGVWNETGTYFDFTIAPAYYQTTWFRVLLAIAFLMLLGVIYQLRLRQVAGQVRARMEERLEERERIARDLHDTLLQSVLGLILKFHAVATQMGRDEPARKALEETLDHADEVLAEGRDRLRNLRATSIPFGGLPAAFERVAEETSQGADATFKTVVEGRVRELHPMVREECYWIGREAVVNALTHSKGRKVEVEITYSPRQFRLRVRDDGRGIDPKILEEGGRSDHWGLQGMRERAQKIGGQLKLWSRPETGTEVELIIPRASAYQTARDKSKKFWLRPSSGNNDAAPKA